MENILNYGTSINHNFWNGNFYAIEHNIDFFIDIDDENDLNRYYKLINKK